MLSASDPTINTNAEIAPFVFVLGMHRSGTSCLAGCLELCGLFLGEVRRTGRFNAKGYYEIEAAQRLHDQILGLNQGSWLTPPSSIKVHPQLGQALTKIAEQLSQRRPCGIKDPRLLLLLECWREIAPKPQALVGTFRHPLAVAESLHHRNGIPIDKGVNLWLRYNEMLIERHRTAPFPVVEYSLTEVDPYQMAVEQIARQLGLKPRTKQLRGFISRNLSHHSSDAPVPAECRSAYSYLKEQAVNRFTAVSPRGTD